MEITEKEKYIATHWGQKVLVDIDNSGNKQYYPIVQSNMYRIEESHLELVSIHDISDKDVIEWYETMCPPNHRKAPKEQLKKWNQDFDTFYPQMCKDLLFFIFIHAAPIETIDFLRGKGYAIQWGKYYVEDLIKEGVLILKK